MEPSSEAKPIVVFDQGHGNLVDPLSKELDEQGFSELVSLLETELGFEVGDPVEGKLTPVSLRRTHVFVFAAPIGQLTGDEIDYIWRFVREGGGLLLLNSGEAHQHQVYSMNTLAARVGCRFGFYAAHEPTTIAGFAAHYVSGNVNSVKVQEVSSRSFSRLTPVKAEVELKPLVQNDFSWLFAVGTCGYGRIVVSGNTAMFSNNYIQQRGNRQFAANTFRWLAKANPFEFVWITPWQQVELGQPYACEIGLRNPTNEPVKFEKISIQSSVNDEISTPSVRELTLYPDKNSTDVSRLRWEIKPMATLGEHVLSLRLHQARGETIYQKITSFRMVMPGHTHLTISKKQDVFKRDIFVGESFEVVGTGAIARLQQQSIQFTCNWQYSPQLREIASEAPSSLKRTFVAKTAGTYPIALHVKDTGQTVETHLVIRDTDASQIEAINDSFVRPLDDEIRRILPCLSAELTDPALAQIPFRFLPLEEYIPTVFLFEPAAHEIWDVVHAAYWDEQENESVVADLLLNLAPIYIPRAGAFIPFAPDLVSRLLETSTTRREELVINFLKGNQMSNVEMRRRIASYLAHEKYGHGFFYTCTKLGRQLAILDKYTFLDKFAGHILTRPFPRKLYDTYQKAIMALQHSVLIANEGFAAWIELNLMRRMEPEIHAIIPERERYMREAKTLLDVQRDSPYFISFPPPAGQDSPYEEGRQHLDSIQGFYPEDYGPKCAVQAFLVATAIPLGISDAGDSPCFALPADVLTSTILNKAGGDARSDFRLWKIRRVLEESTATVRRAQERLQCYRGCLHPKCPVRAQIAEKLGWEEDCASTKPR